MYQTSVREMADAFKKLTEDGHGDVPVYSCRSSSGDTGELGVPRLKMNEVGLYDIGPLCEEFIGENVAVLSVD